MFFFFLLFIDLNMVCNPLQKLASPKNTKNPTKLMKIKILKKKNHLEGSFQWTCVPNLVQNGTYLGIEVVPFLYLLRTHRLTNIFVISYFVANKKISGHSRLINYGIWIPKYILWTYKKVCIDFPQRKAFC